jgi:hypothetical protein
MPAEPQGQGHDGARRRRWWGALLLAAACACWAPQATAQTEADEMARRHFEAGTAYLGEGDYEDALREFRRAFDLSGRAELLINVATVEERLGDLAAAVATLERYVALDPQGEHAETMRGRLERLRKRLDKQRAREPEADPAPAAQPASPAPSAPAPEPRATESPSRLPVWVLFGVAGASAIGAGVTGVIALGEHANAEDTCSPECTDDQLATGRTMALTSTVLTGVSVIAAGTGLVLLLTTGKADEDAVALGVSGGPGAALARARIRF